MVKTYWVWEDGLWTLQPNYERYVNGKKLKNIQVLKKSDIEKEIDDRMEYWSRPKPTNIEIIPKEVEIMTDELFKIQSGMIVEELNEIKKRLGI
jgi:hypothetical protein